MHLNLQMINMLRSESVEINSAFARAEQVSRQRAQIERGISKMYRKLDQLRKLELAAFHDAVGMVTV